MKKETLTTTGSVISAFLASLCCIGPIVFAILGIGGIGFATALEAYRPYLIVLTIIFLGLAFYFTYGKKKVDCGDGTVCKVPRAGKWNKIMLWIATLVVVFFIAFPYFNWAPQSKAVTSGLNTQIVTLRVEGMTCQSCNNAVNITLTKLDGVIKSDADYTTGKVEVIYAPDKVTIDQIIEAVNNLGYRVTSP